MTPSSKKREVHVWSLDLSSWSEDHRQVLSADERRRANRYRLETDQRRYILCRSALREILGFYLRISPPDVQFEYSAEGKPALAAHSSGSLHFNLTHSGEQALIAVSSLAPVGIDVEQVRPLNDLDSVAKIVLGDSEWRAFVQTPRAARTNIFYAVWTRKESIVKALGTGLQAPIQTLEVPFDVSMSQFTVCLSNWDSAATTCRVWTLPTAATYRASLALLDDSPNRVAICEFDYPSDLPSRCLRRAAH